MTENLAKKPKYDQNLLTSASKPTEDQNPQVTEIYETDLPLLANISEFQVLHHLLQFQFHFDSKIVKCTAVYFIKTLTHDQDQNQDENLHLSLDNPKKVILDCCSLKVHKVDLISINNADLPQDGQDMKNFYKSGQTDWFTTVEAIKALDYKIDKWSITISGFEKISVIRINYDTLPSTHSLQWRPASGFSYSHGRQVAYTPAAPINNRGLFPTQEHPTAMSTWELFVMFLDQHSKVQQVLCTSDEEGFTVPNENKERKMYFYTNHRLPSSNFAIVIGDFLHYGVELCEGPVVTKFHSFLPIKDEILEDMKQWLRAILTVCQRLFGQLPFPRLDLVIMSSSFTNLGLSSPHLVFLSHSIMTGYYSDLDHINYHQYLYSRIAHEVSHFYFGLSLGAFDWNEEWLSEGFATYVEDIIYKKALEQLGPHVNREDLNAELEITSLLRLIALQNELDITADNSQYQKLLQGHGGRNDDNASVVVDGLVSVKNFYSVHYLKGYFLLDKLNQQVVSVSSESNSELFLAFLKHYVTKFKGQLLTSYIFLQEYFEYFTNICSATNIRENFEGKDAKLEIELIKRNWLTSTSLPEPYCQKITLEPTSIDKILSMFPKCSKSLEKIFKFYKNPSKVSFTPNEFILLLDKILSMENCDRKVLKFLYNEYFKDGKEYNPEIMHRWCEIILKYLNEFADILEYRTELGRLFEYIKNFLLNHPSMGVYLYGEMMISEKSSLQKLAKELFTAQKEILDPDKESVLRDMIF